MKAAVLRRLGAPLTIEERERPAPNAGEVLVRVRGAGVCHSDVHLADGQYPDLNLPLVLGHEIAGEVENRGNVLVYAAWGCGSCRFCERGDEQLCLDVVEAGWSRDGGYAEYVVVPSERYLLPLGELDPVRAAPLADAGLTSYRAVRRAVAWLEEPVDAVVIGIGGLGQFAVQYLKLMTPARVVAVDRDERKLARALELGAEEAHLPRDTRREARAILDFVGSNDSLALANELVEQQGIVVQVGEAEGTMAFGLGAVPHEAHFTASIWGARDELQSVLELARRGALDWPVESLPLTEANRALERVRQGDVAGRLVLVP